MRTDRQTDEHDEGNRRSVRLANAPKMLKTVDEGRRLSAGFGKFGYHVEAIGAAILHETEELNPYTIRCLL